MESESVILAAIGRLESKVDNLTAIEEKVDKLKEDMNTICKFKDTTIRAVQSFEDYKEVRRDLPQHISELRNDIDKHIESTKDIPKLVNKHDKYITYGIGVIITVQLVISFLFRDLIKW